MEPPQKRQRLAVKPLPSFLERVPNEILGCILSFMTVGSSAHLRRTCKQLRVEVECLYPKFKNSFTQHVEVFLQHILGSEKEFHSFRTALIESQAMVSGSCILAALLDTPFEDIDIFTPYYHIDYKERVPSTVEDFLIQKSTSHKKVKWADRYHHNILKDIEGTENFVVSGRNFQLIIVQGEPKKTIARNFDFNVVCNYYDGKKVVLLYPKAVMTRCITILPVQRPIIERFQYRWMKYISRGFTFTPFHLPDFIRPNDDVIVMIEGDENRNRCTRLHEIGVPYHDEVAKIVAKNDKQTEVVARKLSLKRMFDL